ncbi:hypothetical protein CEUSTIGMA_g11027.t1 [Chlamydomonas eustigma]|uniref:Transmembrane protein 19 n=1 Tax=Chlamydomonas eustigma TaxID=1157962 RepID=A0A250XL34_9CHLO|nr:hypothetical protein CEUSTIGMA_g11027.t1 [Chlamydomonas eustigma]|eukprot:GAX83602.1 hypothetical protein CEUSTIGMA_g11027.t1 [Chlamydomonas eustigma]
MHSYSRVGQDCKTGHRPNTPRLYPTYKQFYKGPWVIGSHTNKHSLCRRFCTWSTGGGSVDESSPSRSGSEIPPSQAMAFLDIQAPDNSSSNQRNSPNRAGDLVISPASASSPIILMPFEPSISTSSHNPPTNGQSSGSDFNPTMSSYSEHYRSTQAAVAADSIPAEPEPSGSGRQPLPNPATIPQVESVNNSNVLNSNGDSVAAALARAQAALDKAESSLDSIDSLPSAREREHTLPPGSHDGKYSQLISVAKTITVLGVAAVTLLASNAFGIVVQWVSAVCTGLAVATWGYKKGSLSASGAAAAAVIGTATLGCSLRFGATLLAFFFTSSKLTQFKEDFKASLDDHTKKGGSRDWIQVLCNALVPAVLAVVYGVLVGCVDVPLGPLPNLEVWRCEALTAIMGGYLGYIACCCGDTWASELGPLSADSPRLITTLRPVRKGTNGGVTLLGLSASIFGGAFVGAFFYIVAVVSPTLFVFEHLHTLAIEQWKLIPLGLMAGLIGSVLDSVLGATLQYSGYNTSTGRITSSPGPTVQHISGRPLLSNNAVNAISASCTSLLTALAALWTFALF